MKWMVDSSNLNFVIKSQEAGVREVGGGGRSGREGWGRKEVGVKGKLAVQASFSIPKTS